VGFNARPTNPIKRPAAMYLAAVVISATLNLECSITRLTTRRGLARKARASSIDRPRSDTRFLDPAASRR
jgi:hypothetical protein